MLYHSNAEPLSKQLILNKNFFHIPREKYKKNKHFISFTQNSMSENEEVLNVLKAYQDISYVFSGLLFCTNQKVCFHRKGIVGNTTRSILIKNISSIDLDRFGISNINSKLIGAIEMEESGINPNTNNPKAAPKVASN